MFRFVVVVACVFASAQAGLVGIGAGSYASGPALGAPLLGKVTYNAPETTVVKQPVVVDQQEIRYRAIPTVVQTAPIVKTINPIVQAAPAITYSSLPAVHTISGSQIIGAQGLTYSSGLIGAPGLTYSSGLIGAPGLTYSSGFIGAPGLTYSSGLIGAPGVTLLKK